MGAAAPGLRPPPYCGLRQARARTTGRRWGLERPARAPGDERCAPLPRVRLEGPERPPLRPSPQENRGHSPTGNRKCRMARRAAASRAWVFAEHSGKHQHRNLEREEDSLRRQGRREGGKKGVGGTLK